MLQQLRELLAASNELHRLPARLSELPHLNVVNIQVGVRLGLGLGLGVGLGCGRVDRGEYWSRVVA